MIIKRQKSFANPRTIKGWWENTKRHGKRYIKYKKAFIKEDLWPVPLKDSETRLLQAVDRARNIKLQNNPSFINRLKYAPV